MTESLATTFSEILRHECAQDWQAATGHRFVTELCAGTVPDRVMAAYLVQDHRFLDAFLMLLGAAIASADRFEARLRLGRFAEALAISLRASKRADSQIRKSVDNPTRQQAVSDKCGRSGHACAPQFSAEKPAAPEVNKIFSSCW